MPRTTLNLDAPILEDLKRIQRREGGSLGEVASRLLASALVSRSAAPQPAPGLSWHSQPMKARVDLEDKDAVWALLEDRQRAED